MLATHWLEERVIASFVNGISSYAPHCMVLSCSKYKSSVAQRVTQPTNFKTGRIFYDSCRRGPKENMGKLLGLHSMLHLTFWYMFSVPYTETQLNSWLLSL